ncbi:MAG: nucleoside deaminase [Deltaproteobacteria bacterium]|nr:nucleoside deaminase [Deltaproteobacteria bacterium]
MDYEFFMHKALKEAGQALAAGEFPVGCVIVYDNEVVVTGSRHHSMLALRRLVKTGSSIAREKAYVFTTLEPCLMCYSALIINGIRTIVYAYEDVLGGGTDVDLKVLKPFYTAINAEIIPGILRQESIKLFKTFFSNPNNNYLKETALAKHVRNALGPENL